MFKGYLSKMAFTSTILEYLFINFLPLSTKIPHYFSYKTNLFFLSINVNSKNGKEHLCPKWVTFLRKNMNKY